MKRNLVFLKLGGSLITVKEQPHTPRLEVIERLANEIAEARAQDPGLLILLGHGSGSFGHVPASKYKTHQGVQSTEEWVGFIEVWRQAAELNQLVLRACEGAKLPALALAPSAMVLACRGTVASWNPEPILLALKERLIPVIYGDAVFDIELGGTILSTEELFAHLVGHIQPSRLLFAGNELGVWADYPEKTKLLPEITPGSFPQIKAGLSGSAATDVTGGMADKVNQIVSLVKIFPDLRASIFSGEVPGDVRRALLGENLGTQIHS